jgi:hypothetical protein
MCGKKFVCFHFTICLSIGNESPFISTECQIQYQTKFNISRYYREYYALLKHNMSNVLSVTEKIKPGLCTHYENCHCGPLGVAISPLRPKPLPPAHAGHIAHDLGLGRPKKSHMHDWDFCLPCPWEFRLPLPW